MYCKILESVIRISYLKVSKQNDTGAVTWKSDVAGGFYLLDMCTHNFMDFIF